MFTCVNYPWTRPENGIPASVSISPSGEPAPVQSDGDIDLFPQASRLFGQLQESNVFTGSVNTFRPVAACWCNAATGAQELVARRVHVTSDPRVKQAVRPLTDDDGLALVRSVTPYRYTLDGREAAGVLANDVPAAYAHRTPDGALSVDYNSLLAELWAGVRALSRRLDDLDRRLPALVYESVHTALEVRRRPQEPVPEQQCVLHAVDPE
jgi:hypothetical protein